MIGRWSNRANGSNERPLHGISMETDQPPTQRFSILEQDIRVVTRHSLNSDFKSCSENGLGVFERHRAQSSLIMLPKRWPIIAAHHSGTRKLSVWISGRRRTAPFDHFRLLPEITERPVSVHKINYAKRNERFNRVYRGNCAWPECHSCLDRLFTQITCGYVVITALLLFFQVFSTFGIELWKWNACSYVE